MPVNRNKTPKPDRCSPCHSSDTSVDDRMQPTVAARSPSGAGTSRHHQCDAPAARNANVTFAPADSHAQPTPCASCACDARGGVPTASGAVNWRVKQTTSPSARSYTWPSRSTVTSMAGDAEMVPTGTMRSAAAATGAGALDADDDDDDVPVEGLRAALSSSRTNSLARWSASSESSSSCSPSGVAAASGAATVMACRAASSANAQLFE